MSEAKVSSHLSLNTMMYEGMTVMTQGIIMVARYSMNRTFLPTNFRRANAYADSELMNSDPATTDAVTIHVLSRNRPKFSTDTTFRKFSQCHFPDGMNVGGNVK